MKRLFLILIISLLLSSAIPIMVIVFKDDNACKPYKPIYRGKPATALARSASQQQLRSRAELLLQTVSQIEQYKAQIKDREEGRAPIERPGIPGSSETAPPPPVLRRRSSSAIRVMMRAWFWRLG